MCVCVKLYYREPLALLLHTHAQVHIFSEIARFKLNNSQIYIKCMTCIHTHMHMLPLQFWPLLLQFAMLMCVCVCVGVVCVWCACGVCVWCVCVCVCVRIMLIYLVHK